MVSGTNTSSENSLLYPVIGSKLKAIKEAEQAIQDVEVEVKEIVAHILETDELGNNAIQDMQDILQSNLNINPKIKSYFKELVKFLTGNLDSIKIKSEDIKLEIVLHISKIQELGNKEDFELMKKYLNIPSSLNIFEFLRDGETLNQSIDIIFGYIQNITPGKAQQGIFNMLFPKITFDDFIDIYNNTPDSDKQRTCNLLSRLLHLGNNVNLNSYKDLQNNSMEDKLELFLSQEGRQAQIFLFTLLFGDINKENIASILKSENVPRRVRKKIIPRFRKIFSIPKEVELVGIIMGTKKIKNKDEVLKISESIENPEGKEFFKALTLKKKEETKKVTRPKTQQEKVTSDEIKELQGLSSYEERKEKFNQEYSEVIGIEYSRNIDLCIVGDYIKSIAQFKKYIEAKKHVYNFLVSGRLENVEMIINYISTTIEDDNTSELLKKRKQYQVKRKPDLSLINSIAFVQLSTLPIDILKDILMDLIDPHYVPHNDNEYITEVDKKLARERNVLAPNKNKGWINKFKLFGGRGKQEKKKKNIIIDKYHYLREYIEMGKKLYETINSMKDSEKKRISSYYFTRGKRILTGIATKDSIPISDYLSQSMKDLVSIVQQDPAQDIQNLIHQELDKLISHFKIDDEDKNGEKKVLNIRKRLFFIFKHFLKHIINIEEVVISRWKTFRSIDFKANTPDSKTELVPLKWHQYSEDGVRNFIQKGNFEIMNIMANQKNYHEEEVEAWKKEFTSTLDKIYSTEFKNLSYDKKRDRVAEYIKEVEGRLQLGRDKGGGYTHLPFSYIMKVLYMLYGAENRVDKHEGSIEELKGNNTNYFNGYIHPIDHIVFKDLNINELRDKDTMEVLVDGPTELFITFIIQLFAARIAGFGVINPGPTLEELKLTKHIMTRLDDAFVYIRPEDRQNKLDNYHLSVNCIWGMKPIELSKNVYKNMDPSLLKKK